MKSIHNGSKDTDDHLAPCMSDLRQAITFFHCCRLTEGQCIMESELIYSKRLLHCPQCCLISGSSVM